MGATAFVILNHHGLIDRQFIEWLRPIVGADKLRYSELSTSEIFRGVLALTDEQLRAGFQPGDPRRHIAVQKFTLPFLTSQIPSLFLFSPEFQRLILEIRAKLGVLNDDIDATWFYFTKPLDSGLSTHNYQVLQGNTRELRVAVAQSAREIADDITDPLSRRK
jgi:hypothetical protein